MHSSGSPRGWLSPRKAREKGTTVAQGGEGGASVKCGRCGTENVGGMKFCGECGAPLARPPTGTMTRDASLGRPHADSRGADGERKLVTVLFADVAGFTTLAETLDPEPLRDLINACFGRLVPCVERYGGTVDKFIGDEIMALFGAPVAHDNDPERAVRAALDMREALQAFNAERGTALQAHFGLNTGLVLAGAVGAGGRSEYSVMGDAVNVASRLAETSAPGEILVGPDTYRVAGHLFQCKEAGPVRIRGRAEARTVYRVLGARAAAGPKSMPAGRWVGSPLVGREREKQAFVAALDRTLQGEGGILAIVADAGLGKSRLTAEVRRLAGPELTWLEGRTLSFGRTISYWPFLELVQAAAGIDSDDDEGKRSEKLERLVERLFVQETADVLPYLATLLTLPVPEELQDKVRYLGGEAMGHQVFRTMRLFVSRLAKKRPLVLVFEDVHWLDASSVELLEHLLPLSREAPVLFCLVGRPEPDSPTLRLQHLARETYADRFQELLLAPLSADETHALVGNLVGLRDLPVGLRDTIDHRAEGNPFFVEEVIRALIDLGGLVPGETGGWRVTDKAQEITIPDTLQGVIMTRIDRLDEELKAVLRLAAVIGRSFFYRVLRSLAEAERRLDDDIAALQSLELVREKAREPELEYIFKHALVQEATYESILLQRRKGLHLRVAQAIETLFADRLEEFYGLLAYHYTKAEDWVKAQEYLLKAGDQAGKIAADAEALAHYEQAVDTHFRAYGDTWDPFQRVVLERKTGEAIFRRGDLERAREHFYRAMASLDHPMPMSEAALRRAIAKEALRQVAHRVVPWSFRRSPSEDEVRDAVELARIIKNLVWIDVVNEPMRTLFERLLTLNLCERAGFKPGISLGFSHLGTSLDFVAAPRLGRFYVGRGFALAEEVGEPNVLAAAHWRLGLHELFVGEWDTSLEHLFTSARLNLSLGDLHDWGAAMHMASALLLDQGEPSAALSLAAELVRLGQEAGDSWVETLGHMVTGEVLYQQGAFAEAERRLRPAADALVAAPDLFNASRAGGRLGHCYLRLGDVDQAVATLEDHRHRIAAHHLRSIWCRNVWTGLAAAGLLIAEQAAESGRERALNEAKEACDAVLKHAKVDRGALCAGYRTRGTYEWLAGHRRKAEGWWRKSLAVAEDLGARYEEALPTWRSGGA